MFVHYKRRPFRNKPNFEQDNMLLKSHKNLCSCDICLFIWNNLHPFPQIWLYQVTLSWNQTFQSPSNYMCGLLLISKEIGTSPNPQHPTPKADTLAQKLNKIHLYFVFYLEHERLCGRKYTIITRSIFFPKTGHVIKRL